MLSSRYQASVDRYGGPLRIVKEFHVICCMVSNMTNISGIRWISQPKKFIVILQTPTNYGPFNNISRVSPWMSMCGWAWSKCDKIGHSLSLSSHGKHCWPITCSSHYRALDDSLWAYLASHTPLQRRSERRPEAFWVYGFPSFPLMFVDDTKPHLSLYSLPLSLSLLWSPWDGFSPRQHFGQLVGERLEFMSEVIVMTNSHIITQYVRFWHAWLSFRQ